MFFHTVFLFYPFWPQAFFPPLHTININWVVRSVPYRMANAYGLLERPHAACSVVSKRDCALLDRNGGREGADRGAGGPAEKRLCEAYDEKDAKKADACRGGRKDSRDAWGGAVACRGEMTARVVRSVDRRLSTEGILLEFSPDENIAPLIEHVMSYVRTVIAMFRSDKELLGLERRFLLCFTWGCRPFTNGVHEGYRCSICRRPASWSWFLKKWS